MLTRRTVLTAGAAAAWTAASSGVHAQTGTYPNKSIRLIVPFPAGGGTDAVARMVSQKLGEALGQSLVVDNKAGAGTTIGLAELARSPADGYTIGVGGTSDPLLPYLVPDRKRNELRRAPMKRGQRSIEFAARSFEVRRS